MLSDKWCKSKLLIKTNFILSFKDKFRIIIKNSFSKLTKITYISKPNSHAPDSAEDIIVIKYFNKIFPINYNFEYKKLTFRLNNFKIKKALLQFPDGLQKYGILLYNFLKNSCMNSKSFLISSRTTFGACCAEDFLGKFIGACIVLHYGHSCLFPILDCTIPMMYIFLEIRFDHNFITDVIKESSTFSKFSFFMFSTIQYASILKNIKSSLNLSKIPVHITSNAPLSPGEVLGCTCLEINNVSNIVFIGEGRFHLEATIISNSFCRFFQFNPFSQYFTLVDFNTAFTCKQRQKEILKSFFGQMNIGVIIGTLGRQGNNSIIKKLQELIYKKKFDSILLSATEISSDILEVIGYKIIDTWVQVVCPRLSIDWGKCFIKPLLTTYEFGVLLGFNKWKFNQYPLDYYSYKGGYWTNYFESQSIFNMKKKKLLI
jgi:2-(3-amino-3-carboxypropyl)histidine synthase